MSCREFRNRMQELETGSGVEEHLRHCPSCTRWMAEQRILTAGLHEIAGEREGVQAPARLETSLREAFRNRTAARSMHPAPRKPIPWLAWVPAMAAVIVLVFVWGPSRHPRQHPASGAQAAVTDPALLGADFIPLPDSADFGGSADPDLIRVELPRSALIALGVALPLDTEGGPVEAEVALGADGMMRGIRIVQ